MRHNAIDKYYLRLTTYYLILFQFPQITLGGSDIQDLKILETKAQVDAEKVKIILLVFLITYAHLKRTVMLSIFYD